MKIEVSRAVGDFGSGRELYIFKVPGTETTFPGDINRDKKIYHPTQKPVLLLEYLIKTYTLENELVLDNCVGVGSTALACLNTNRDCIGIELDSNFYDITKDRIRSHFWELEK